MGVFPQKIIFKKIKTFKCNHEIIDLEQRKVHTWREYPKNTSSNFCLLSSVAAHGTAGFTSKYNSKIRRALKDLELQADLVHEKTSGA